MILANCQFTFTFIYIFFKYHLTFTFLFTQTRTTLDDFFHNMRDLWLFTAPLWKKLQVL